MFGEPARGTEAQARAFGDGDRFERVHPALLRVFSSVVADFRTALVLPALQLTGGGVGSGRACRQAHDKRRTRWSALLRDTWQAMSHENVELVRQGYEAFAEGDLERVFARFSSQIEWDMSRRLVDPGVYRGGEEVRTFVAGIQEAWSHMRHEPQKYIDAGDSIVVTVRGTNTGRSSGIEVTATASWVWECQAGSVVRVTMYQTEADALEAVGLRE
ncbi:MAG: hypothetical protein NVSMB51_05670 [Solirubrobacteraceae bacterium]